LPQKCDKNRVCAAIVEGLLTCLLTGYLKFKVLLSAAISFQILIIVYTNFKSTITCWVVNAKKYLDSCILGHLYISFLYIIVEECWCKGMNALCIV